ncbi:DNA adenine methylase [Azotobacter vinelandii]|uniref:DNA adenine methylase n=1 Tax=Azotobacter vinelandii TaxID=354 RepID=UPI0007736546|nr:DNA adenine methylase [Azotobacter vinelandii]
MSLSTPVIRYHGGKFRLADWVIRHFPPHHFYVEPFGGAASVLLCKERSHGEVYNDLDGDIVNLFRVLQDPASRQALTERLVLTPYARDEYRLAWEDTSDLIERARRTIIRAQMGFGASGATKGSTGFRINCQRAYSTAQQVWSRYPDSLAAIGQRFAGVLIENRPAIEVMQQHDHPQTLHYVDPPYLHGTRALRNGTDIRSSRTMSGNSHRYYRHEMTDADHEQLLLALRRLGGMVVLSGYPSDLYRDTLDDWFLTTTTARISAGRGTGLRTECLWLNPQALEHSRQLRLFHFKEVFNG